ncbi:MAG: hypothetical protein HN348_20595 [Proteobacteria bacterium]|jgi:hypothetical protein|nr:hypothetical protein [Pseudomonadota bacterium]
MPNLFIPRQTVHDWSETIGQGAAEHQAALTRLLRDQRRLSKFVEENQAEMDPATAGITLYLTGVIIRLFDLAGGRMRGSTWAQIRGASSKVQGAVSELLPIDDGFVDRARQIDRAQPHILDEALMALFVRGKEKDEEVDLETEECFKIYLLLWVITEVLDGNWKPRKGFAGAKEYEYFHIELDDDEEEAAEEAAEE